MRPILAVTTLLLAVPPAAAQNPQRRGDDVADPHGVVQELAVGDRLDAVELHAGSGHLRELSGRIATEGADLSERADHFLRSWGAQFGVDGDVKTGPVDDRAGRAAAHVAQHVHGFELLGHGLSMRFDDDGRVVHAHGVIEASAAATPAPRISKDAAIQAAFDRTDFDPAELVGEPSVRSIARMTDHGIDLVQRVEVVDGVLPWAIEIDAWNGSLLRVVPNVFHTGELQFDGTSTPFKTGSGKGNVYKKMKHATSGTERKASLPGLIQEDVNFEVAVDGLLIGPYAKIVEPDGLAIWDPAKLFLFADDDMTWLQGVIPYYQLFDHVNTYYWITKMGAFFEKALGTFAGAYPILTIVNFDDEGFGFVNAFYSPADGDGPGGFPPGYFVFGEFTTLTGDVMDDLSRDPSIVCHEYTHMVVDKEGYTFGDAGVDEPPRAVNEALADFAAASYLKHPAIGSALAANAPEMDFGDALRDLSGDQTMDDLWDEVGGATLLPEEHWTGGIFAAALWDARMAVKKKANGLVFESLVSWPLGTAEVGFPVVNTGNATDAYHAYFHACGAALADFAIASGGKGQKLAGGILGGFMGRNISGTRPDTIYTFDATETGLNTVIASSFRGSATQHEIDILLSEGQKLSISAKGVQGTVIDFAFDDTPGDGDSPGDFTYLKPKKVNAAGTKASQKSIGVNTTRIYRLTLDNPSEAGGGYKVAIRVK